MDQTACCTCARLLSQTPRVIASSSSSSLSEKEKEKHIPLPENRQLDCCGRVICGSCIHTNPRFNTYCPYCQTSSNSSSSSSSSSPLPARFSLLTSRSRRRPGNLKPEEEEETKEPPPYSSSPVPSPAQTTSPPTATEEPPPYTAEPTENNNNKNETQPPSYDILQIDNNNNIDIIDKQKNQNQEQDRAQDSSHENDEDEEDEDSEQEPILHYLNHPNDTIPSLSLRYNIPPQFLRSFNRLNSDHLLLGRQTILIPREKHLQFPHYLKSPYQQDLTSKDKSNSNSKSKMKSLSPTPIHTPEEQTRRSKIRKWMVAVKCPDYDIALLYLSQSSYDLDKATENYFADESWEKDHPFIPSTATGSSSSTSRGSTSASASGSGSGNNGNGKWNKIRDYHCQRLGRIPPSLLQPSTSTKW